MLRSTYIGCLIMLSVKFFFSTIRTFSKICTLKQLKCQFLILIASVLNPDKHNTVFCYLLPYNTFRPFHVLRK